MTRRHSLFLSVLLISATSALNLSGRGDPPAHPMIPATVLPFTPAKKRTVAHNFGRLPLSFERNRGQTNPRVRFLTHTNDSTLFLTPSEAVFTLPAQTSRSNAQAAQRRDRKASRVAEKITRVALRMQMVGANPSAAALTQQPLEGRINYFIGKEPGKWHAGVPTFGRVGFQGVYPGVDLVYYGNQQQLEYDFVVAPYADPKQIQLHFAGAQGVHLNAAGDLLVRTEGRELNWRKPTVYQQDATGKHPVSAHFRLERLRHGRTDVRFALGHYDTARPLIIDPVLLYSTYLGGSASDVGKSIALDSSGNVYIAGYAFSIDFPTTTGVLEKGKPGTHSDAFVTKMNATGTALVYSTYLGGGSGSNGDQAAGIAVDSSGNTYVTGFTTSTDFPVSAGAFQGALRGSSNAFVTKMNATGTTVLYSTYLGGTASDSGKGIAIDSSGNAYITGYTGSTDFPSTPSAFQKVKKGVFTNAFVTKVNSLGNALLYSTYLGGSNTSNGDQATAIAVDSGGNAYITGDTSSADFPVTAGAFQKVKKAPTGSHNAFVTKFNSSGSALLYSTYLGGTTSPGDSGNGIAIDSSGNAYVTGDTSSTDFPITPSAFQQVRKGNANASNAFVTKLNSTGAALLYSTYLGGSTGSGDQANGIAVLTNGDAYVTGFAFSGDFPTTVGAYQRVKQGGDGISNAFVTKLNTTGSTLLYSTYLGGSGNDQAAGLAINNSTGTVYVTGHTASPDFPVTSGALQISNHATSPFANGFVTKLSAVPIFPDVNNDGFTDLFIQNSSTSVIASWFMRGATWTGGAYFNLTPAADFVLVGAGDFSGAGDTTLVLQSRTTNQVAFWFTKGTDLATISGGSFINTTPSAGWKVVGVGNFSQGRGSNLLFQNQTTRQIAIWFMEGVTYRGGIVMPFIPPVGWTAVGAGDFNGDGFVDIVFQNQTSNQIALWYMNGSTYADGATLTVVPASGWKVVGVGDYNGDGFADLLFQNQTSNQAAVWYLQNGNFIGGDALSLTPPTGWKIVGPR